jgi:hypothetical protein
LRAATYAAHPPLTKDPAQRRHSTAPVDGMGGATGEAMTPCVEEPPPASRRRLPVSRPGRGAIESILRSWRSATATLLARSVITATARETIECQKRLCDEMFEWILPGGVPPGDFLVATADGVPQGIAAVEVLERSLFIHYLVSAPWNALTAGDLADLRTTRGACSALIVKAVQRSAGLGFAGRVSLEAINDRCRAIYQHLGFERRPLEELGGAIPIDLYGATNAHTRCWMQLEPARSRRFVALLQAA